jgi:hypothetical protein
MKRLLSLLGLSVILLTSSVVLDAPVAAAQEAFTCAAGGGSRDFKDAHCKEKVTAGTGSFGHVAFTGSTSITASNESTGGSKVASFFKAIWSGVVGILRSTDVQVTGTFQNSAGNVSGSIVIQYNHVTVDSPSGKGCEEESKAGIPEQIVTETLSVSNAGLTNEIKLSPAKGEVIAEFNILHCSIAALNHTYSITGSVKGQITGATINFTHENTTGQGTMFEFGQKAGLEGTLTVKGANGNGLAIT